MANSIFIKADELAKELDISLPRQSVLLGGKPPFQLLLLHTLPVLEVEGSVPCALPAVFVGWHLITPLLPRRSSPDSTSCLHGLPRSCRKDALAWEREFLLQQAADLTMTFEAFVEIYITDKKKRLRENTWSVKEHIIRTKILPYFKEKRLSEIKPRDVIAWQNEMLNYRDKNGKAYSPTYLKTLHGQLSAILNHAVRFYGLKSNAAATAGCMGSEKHKEMLFWTKEEYLKFAEAMMDKPQSYYAFEVLYWCGIREGELLALTPADFDLDKGLLSITKSYQRLKGRDVITDPKTPKSVRVIQMPQFLTDEIRDYLKSFYKVQPDQRIFEVTKSYLHHEMDRGAKEAGVKRIRIHDLRHSHVSLLIEMGFSALAIADRVGHESVDITYKYAHLFPSKQQEMAQKLDMERKEG